MFSLWSDERVVKYSGQARDTRGRPIPMPVSNASQSDLLIDFWLKAAKDAWGFRWAIQLKSSDTFCGIVGFNSLCATYEIAYHLSSNYWKKGIMTEATLEAISWAQKRNASSVEAYIEAKNRSSINLATRIGLKETNEFSQGARKYIKIF
jgi:RimJ/RimL family protein N-acetyltransferase